MKTALRVAIEEAAWRILFGGVVPGFLTYYATFEVAWSFAAGFGIVLLAFGLYISDWIIAYRQALPRTNSGMYRRLKDWAEIAGMSIKGNPQDTAYFAFIVEDPQRRVVNIIRGKDSPDALRLAAKIIVSPEQEAVIRGFSQAKLQDFGNEIRSFLLLLGVGSTMNRFPAEMEVNNLVDISSIRNRIDFLNALMLIRRATAAVQDRIRRATSFQETTA